MSASSPPREERMSQSPTLVSEVMIASSEVSEAGSAFKRTDPASMKGSWGIVTIRERMISRGMTCRSKLSILIVPESMSMIRRRTERSELLPLQRLENED